MKKAFIEKSYQLAKEQYAGFGVDTDKVLKQLDNVNISLHCWQTDDVGGFGRAVQPFGACLGQVLTREGGFSRLGIECFVGQRRERQERRGGRAGNDL